MWLIWFKELIFATINSTCFVLIALKYRMNSVRKMNTDYEWIVHEVTVTRNTALPMFAHGLVYVFVRFDQGLNGLNRPVLTTRLKPGFNQAVLITQKWSKGGQNPNYNFKLIFGAFY